MRTLRTIDIVTPLYNEEENVRTFFKRLSNAIPKHCKWRLILVNDGSRDRTEELVNALIEEHPENILLVNLSRNFGHQSAITAGLSLVKAETAVVIDGDLQDPPETISDMISKWEEGSDVVVAKRNSRRDLKGLRGIGFRLFHLALNRFSQIDNSANTGVFALMSAKVVSAFNSFSERHRFIPGLRDFLGFKREYIFYDRAERNAGEAKQTLPQLVGYALDALFSFSYRPLRFLTYSGLLICLVSFSLASVFVIKRLAGIETADTGFTTLVTLILLMGGGQLMGLGILGEYIGRIYDECKNRPMYVIDTLNGNQK